VHVDSKQCLFSHYTIVRLGVFEVSRGYNVCIFNQTFISDIMAGQYVLI
jgi:hypothetical protein